MGEKEEEEEKKERRRRRRPWKGPRKGKALPFRSQQTQAPDRKGGGDLAPCLTHPPCPPLLPFCCTAQPPCACGGAGGWPPPPELGRGSAAASISPPISVRPPSTPAPASPPSPLQAFLRMGATGLCLLPLCCPTQKPNVYDSFLTYFHRYCSNINHANSLFSYF